MESEFPSNSQKKAKAKEPEPKKIQRVTSSEVVRRKKPLGKRFAEVFTGGDARGVGAYVFFDVLIPAAKDMMADATSQGVERMLFGEARSSSRRNGARPRSDHGFVSYNRFAPISTNNRREDPRDRDRNPSRRSRATHNFDEIIVATRVEAEEVIDRLFDLIARYEQASVAELYELVDVRGDYTDDKWGWTDIRGSNAVRVRDGYLLDLPRPEPLD